MRFIHTHTHNRPGLFCFAFQLEKQIILSALSASGLINMNSKEKNSVVCGIVILVFRLSRRRSYQIFNSSQQHTTGSHKISCRTELRLFNDAILTAKIIQRQMTLEDYYDYKM